MSKKYLIFDTEADFKLLMQPEYKCIVHAI